MAKAACCECLVLSKTFQEATEADQLLRGLVDKAALFQLPMKFL